MGVELERSERREITTGERLASRARGHTLSAYSQATRELYGEEWQRRLASQLPKHVQVKLDQPPEWIPVEYAIAWMDAVWEGPMRQDRTELVRFVDRVLDHGFGREKRLLLTIATPPGVVRRASELWRGEMSDGRVVSYGTSPTSARFVLYDHPFLEHPLWREITAETFRYAVALAGAKDAIEQHEGDLGQPLVVNVSWS